MFEGCKSLIGWLTYCEKDGVTLGSPDNFEGNSSIEDLDMHTGGTWVICDDDALYTTEYERADPVPHPYYKESNEHQLYYWLIQKEHTDYQQNWAYERICRGQPEQTVIPLNNWHRSFWKRHMKIGRLVDSKINSLVLQLAIEHRT